MPEDAEQRPCPAVLEYHPYRKRDGTSLRTKIRLAPSDDDPFLAGKEGERAELEEIDGKRQYSFRDVIGPDEYHDHVDNNTFTNRMALIRSL